MRDVVSMIFLGFWLIAVLVGISVGLLTRTDAGRRWLRRWIKLPTLIWWETERTVERSAEVAAAMADLRVSLPGAKTSLLPRFFVVRVVEDDAGQAIVRVRAATLLQAKTAAEAAARVTDGLDEATSDEIGSGQG